MVSRQIGLMGCSRRLKCFVIISSTYIFIICFLHFIIFPTKFSTNWTLFAAPMTENKPSRSKILSSLNCGTFDVKQCNRHLSNNNYKIFRAKTSKTSEGRQAESRIVLLHVDGELQCSSPSVVFAVWF